MTTRPSAKPETVVVSMGLLEMPVPMLIPAKQEVEASDAKRPAKKARKEPPPISDAAAQEGSEATTLSAPAGASRSKKKACAPVAEGIPAAGNAVGVEVAEAAGDKIAASEGANWLVVGKTVRGLLKASPTPMHCSSDALPALNAKVSELINDAIGRALANGRKTIKNCDF